MSLCCLPYNQSTRAGECDKPIFAAPRSFAADKNPSSIAIGDLNGDGKLDLAVANSGSTNVSILLGNGDGTFQPVVNFPATGRGTVRLGLGDLNRDHIPDVVAMNNQTSDITVLLANSDGTLQTGVDYLVGATPMSVAIADFNRNRGRDLAVAAEIDSRVTILLNTGAMHSAH